MKKLTDLFIVEYGNKLDLNKMTRLSTTAGGIDFIGRSGERNGVTATVAPLAGTAPYPPGAVTVALGGSLLSAFVQLRPFYTAQNVAVLKPRSDVVLSFEQKVFLCLCIRHNRFRYSAFGREANRTLRDLWVPDPEEFPLWVGDQPVILDGIEKPEHSDAPPLPTVETWRSFRLGALFDVRKGKRFIRRERTQGQVPFIGAARKNNGIVSYVPGTPMFPAGSITIPYNGEGGTGYALYQPRPFSASDDVQVLVPLSAVDQAALMFICVVLRRERYRYSFGRKWHLGRMRETEIRLPITDDGNPDWQKMSEFMRSLPFSSTALN
jgi:hypothetical protein